MPQSLGGSDEPDNLALACSRCNGRRYNFTTGIDPETKQEVPLFNPRQQQWAGHFIWRADGLNILGTTPTGRATCARLDLNDERYDEDDSIRKIPSFPGSAWERVLEALPPPTSREAENVVTIAATGGRASREHSQGDPGNEGYGIIEKSLRGEGWDYGTSLVGGCELQVGL